MHTLIFRDVRLAGWKPRGDVVEVNFDTPLQWLMECIKDRNKKFGRDLKVIMMCHGLPGYVQCSRGKKGHPTAGNGVTIDDLSTFAQIKGSLKRLELYACLVARIGSSPECGSHIGYDGNAFCFKLAQTIGAEVKASTHLQYYYDGTKGVWIFRRPDGTGINFGEWNGRVFTWGAKGNIIDTQDFPYRD